MKIHLVPAFEDNYLFVAEVARKSIVVDPGEAEPIINFLTQSNLDLEIILVTHHHPDHAGGVVELKQRFPQARVIGPSSLSTYGIRCDRMMNEGDTFQFGEREWQVMALPGHTLDHLGYYSAGLSGGSSKSVADLAKGADELPILFCGDVLFSFGCGRIFEGTFEQMFNSLKRIGALPTATSIYCAHEYTLRNLEFTIDYLRAHTGRDASTGREISTSIAPYLRLLEVITKKRSHNEPTVPTTLEFEQQYNLFLRAQTVEEFAAVRTARNQF